MPFSGVSVLDAASLTIGGIFFVIMVWAAAMSVSESEHRAAGISAVLALVVPAPYVAAGLASFPHQGLVTSVLLGATAVTVLTILVPTKRSRALVDDTPRGRIDERDIMFSRRLLKPGTTRFQEYYRANPEKKAPDDTFRARPGLLAKGSSGYHAQAFAAADASFSTIERLRAHVDGEPAPERVQISVDAITAFVKRWALKLGAVSVGCTKLKDYHLYSTVGRGDDYGKPVTLDHPYAIALTVEMDKGMLDRAPLAPTVMESAQQYVASGVIAVQIAEFLRNLGYHARAHIDGNYRVVCPLVARDAGLGEIGRMGLLMTPELGPRVRIAVVTTDLPLAVSERRRDWSVIDFCTHCRKCADVCPSQAIPLEGRTPIDGVLRWQIDSEACFTLWCAIGTDCARCVSVCPYSHPDSLLHNLVRFGVRQSTLFRRLAIVGDDVFYGKRPPPAELPGWMTLKA